MEDIVAEAQKRRAKFLKEWEKVKAKMTLVKFGRLHGMTGERMGQHIKKARLEAQG
jgi:predicted AlkP superfamily pyrophosphatase or phosphodiesterase